MAFMIKKSEERNNKMDSGGFLFFPAGKTHNGYFRKNKHMIGWISGKGLHIQIKKYKDPPG
jgi:hypothetical protein